MPHRNVLLTNGVSFRRGIIRDAALCVLCRYRHKTHWTAAKPRLDRDFGSHRFGSNAYAMEELVAELGAVFLCADLELATDPREENVSYIANWLEVLKNDNKAVFTAAAHAQRAADFIHKTSARSTEAAA
jgi:antirestriction protein ArdC